MQAEPQSEHQWLQRLVGKWSMESECSMGPEQPVIKSHGSEEVRSLGGLWTIGEGTGQMSEATVNSIMTLGYDPTQKRFVGSFVASCMSQIWIYSGSLDESGRVLILDTEGPSFSGNGNCRYQDLIEFHSDDHRTLRSRMHLADGNWLQFMEAHYRRLA